MRISFIVNEPLRRACGGYKIIYQYANYLASKSNEVTIYYRCRKGLLYSNHKAPFFIKLIIAQLSLVKGIRWFDLDTRINNKLITSITNRSIADGDIVIATAVTTANEVNELSPAKGKKFYFIQHFEDWSLNEFKVRETYTLGMTNIVIAKWLKRIVDKEAKTDSILIPNSIDKNVFYINKCIVSRKPASIAVLYHTELWKGSQDAIQVLNNIRDLYEDLQVEMFGGCEKPKNLPSWISYTTNASQDQLLKIYNNSSIFLCTSWSEGFGLTGAESMFCGCALVTTDTLGVREYADERNSIICQPRDIDALTKGVCKLIDDNEFRIELAKLGHASVASRLDYNKACQSFEQSLNQ